MGGVSRHLTSSRPLISRLIYDGAQGSALTSTSVKWYGYKQVRTLVHWSSAIDTLTLPCFSTPSFSSELSLWFIKSKSCPTLTWNTRRRHWILPYPFQNRHQPKNKARQIRQVRRRHHSIRPLVIQIIMSSLRGLCRTDRSRSWISADIIQSKCYSYQTVCVWSDGRGPHEEEYERLFWTGKTGDGRPRCSATGPPICWR